MASSALVVDLLEQCATNGELHHALDAGLMTRDQVRAELGEVVTGMKPGRTSDEEIVIFDSTGTALQDVAVAGLVYERAVSKGVGARFGSAGNRRAQPASPCRRVLARWISSTTRRRAPEESSPYWNSSVASRSSPAGKR